MASWVLIGFLNTSRSHLHNRTFVHSLVLPLALKFYPPPDRNFYRRQIFHLDLSFSAFIFLTSRNFGFVNRLDFTFSENLSMLSRKYESVTVVYFFENLSWWLKAQGLKLIWWKINIHNILKLQDNGHSSSCAHKSGAISSQLGLRTFQAAPAMVQSFSTCQSFKIYKPLFTGCGCASRPACKKNLALLH